MTPPSRTTGEFADVSREAVRERRLLRAARRGDEGARARLVCAHLGLVRSIASRYRDYGLPFDDLVQEGAVGLLDAIEGYDPSRTREFEPYARFRIRRAIRNALTDQARLIRLPKHVVERRRALAGAEARLIAAGKRPSTADLAAVTGLSVQSVVEARTASNAPISLDVPVLPDGSPLETLVADPSASDPLAEALHHELEESLRTAVAKLPPRQRRVVTEQWGLGDSRPTNGVALARELQLSPRRTQTIGHDALHSLRNELELVGAAP
jgi:RNA polymerase primary sigma factor